MAMAGTVTGFAALFRDLGTGAALVQTQNLTDDLCQSVFILNVFLGSILSLTLLALSLPIAALFNEARLANLMLALSPVFLVSSFGIVEQALLERNYLYKHLVVIELSSGAVSLLVAIASALSGLGVYSLVIQSLLGASLTSALLWMCSPWRPKLSIKIDPIKNIWRFSFDNFLFGLLNYFQRNADSLLIGRTLGSIDLGFYSTAYRILLVPLTSITIAVNRASFAVYSRHQHQKSIVGNHYLKTLRNIAYLTAPIMAMVWALREPLVAISLGEKWLPSAELLLWLAPVGYIQSMLSTSGTVFNAVGRSDLLRNFGIVSVPFFVTSFVLGIPWGISGVACAYFVANLLWMIPVFFVVLRQVQVSIWRFFYALVPPTTLGLGLALLLRWTHLQTEWAPGYHVLLW